MDTPPITVFWQGAIAHALLAVSRRGTVAGVTSRGVFINLESGWILFLSFEPTRGPLSLNLSGGEAILAEAEVGGTVKIQGGKIQGLADGVEIDFSRAETWEAPSRSATWLAPGGRARSLKAVAELVLSQRSEPGLYLILQDLLGSESGAPKSPPKPFERLDSARLLQVLKTPSLDAILSAVTPLLGLGNGLTPAGDDLVLGLLLAYCRWGVVLRPAFDLPALSDSLNRAAFQKTTRLSANLIACASHGQADERLVDALDGIMTGHLTPDECARNLCMWGHSSGCETLAGMALAILAAPQ